jgi:hypothetical protein
MKYVVTRNITVKECPWLEDTVPEGTVVTEFTGCDYGCVSPEGVAVTLHGETRFIELPKNALRAPGKVMN